jgi:hypothetical protein
MCESVSILGEKRIHVANQAQPIVNSKNHVEWMGRYGHWQLSQNAIRKSKHILAHLEASSVPALKLVQDSVL